MKKSINLLLCFCIMFNCFLPFITVKAETTPSFDLKKGETIELSIKYNFEGADWEIDDSSIIKIINKGIASTNLGGIYTATYSVTIEGLKTGSTNLYLKNLSGTIVATVIINVNTPITSIELSTISASLEVMETLQLNAAILPEDSDKKELEWYSSDEEVTAVDENGLVTALKLGTAVITVKDKCGDATSQCNINVIKHVVDVDIIEDSIELTPDNNEYLLNYNILPEDAANKNVSFYSSDENVATVDENGLIKAKGNGSAIITITTEDGDYTDNVLVNVNGFIAANRIYFEKDEVILTTDGKFPSYQLTVNVDPIDSTFNKITWSSDNDEIVSVDENGLITAVGIGEALVKAALNDGINYAIIKVKVIKGKYILNFYNVLNEDGTCSFSQIGTPDMEYYYGDKIEFPAIEDGMLIEGWYTDFTDGDFINLIDENYMPEEDTYFYVKTSQISTYKAGDLNSDGKITTTDLVKLRRYLAGLETFNEAQLKAADINEDEKITTTDLVKLRRYLAGLGE